MAESKEKLFDQFPPVSTQEWKEKVVADLKGADFDKKLVWRTNEGFNVNPMYRAEDIECGIEFLHLHEKYSETCRNSGRLFQNDSCRFDKSIGLDSFQSV